MFNQLTLESPMNILNCVVDNVNSSLRVEYNCVIVTEGERYTAIIVICGITISLNKVISIPFRLWQYGYPG